MGNIGLKFNAYTQATKWFTSTIVKTSWKNIFKIFIVVFLFLNLTVFGLFFIRLSKNDAVISALSEKVIGKTDETIRDLSVSPKIHHDLGVLTYTTNASRTFIFELHNGKENISGLPFHYADMTYEEVNENKAVDKSALKFQNMPLTLYKFFTYMQINKVFIGGIDELKNIDSEFAKHVAECGGKYLGFAYITNRGIPLGFFGISYHNMEDVPSDAFIRKKLDETVKVLAVLLDLDEQVKIKE